MDLETSDYNYGYYFLLRRNLDTGEIYVDSFLDVSSMIGSNYLAHQIRAVNNPDERKKADGLARSIKYIELRNRYNQGHTGLVKTDGPLNSDEFEQYCRSLDETDPGQFREFLKKAKI